MIPPEIKPLIAAVSVLGTVTSIEFVLLVVAEIKDGNPWSAGTRIVGLAITALVGIFIWRKFKAVREKITGQDSDSSMPAPCGIVGSSTPAPEPVACAECGMMMFGGESAPKYCAKCWRTRTDNRLEQLEKDRIATVIPDGT